jgi:6-phosphogluconolactonase
MNKQIAVVALVAAAFAACSGERGVAGPARASTPGVAASTVEGSSSPGAVYTLTNQTAENAVAIFDRAADGTLTPRGRVATGGTGTGSGLGSQGALALSADGRWLFAVNAGSSDVSVFHVTRSGLSLADRIPSGGTQPTSLTTHDERVYVLNAGGAGSISGFTVDDDGALSAIPRSSRPLSGTGVGPAQVAFSPDGRALVVTEKNTNRIDVYAADEDGLAQGPLTTPSAGTTPFGFAFGLRHEFFVSEAGGTASSYVLGASARVRAVSRAVSTHQGAPCWLVVTEDGRFAYTANAHSGTISGFAVSARGALRLLDRDGRTASVATGNTDLALSENSRYLYQLNGGGSITAFRVQQDGHLAALGVVTGLPAGVVGLVAH